MPLQKKHNIIITDHLHPYLAEHLGALGCRVDVFPQITREELSAVLPQYEGLVVSTRIRVDSAMIDRGAGLCFIARAGSGMEHIDTAYASKKHIAVISSPEGNANAVAEHALGMLLALMHRIAWADREMRSGIPGREKYRGTELSGRTVGIIGYGNTGSAFAGKLRGLGVHICVYDKYKSGFGNADIAEVSPDALRAQADVISLHVPHDAGTHHMVNEAFLTACKSGLYIINSSRGPVVHTRALLGALHSGKVAGAALDVFENEHFDALEGEAKAEMDALRGLDSVVMTPHIAGWTHESFFKIARILAERIEALLAKQIN